MTHSYDVIVLGVGAMGAATVAELSGRGRRVLGLEQYALVHDRGSSHGHTRVIRKAYFEHPDYVPLLRRAYERWYDLEQQEGRRLFTECGVLSIGRPEGELIAGVRQSARQHHLKVEELTSAEVRQRFPPFRFGDEFAAVLERDAGFLYVEECIRAHIDLARRRGAEVHEHEPVRNWEASAAGVRVHTDRQTYSADRLVITAGAWAGRVLAALGLPLRVVRKVILWHGTSNDAAFRRDVFPIYLTETPLGVYYGFPVLDAMGHKVGRHDGGATVIDPATVDRDISTADVGECTAFLQAHLPMANGSLRQGKVCLYTLTPDQHFIIDLHPAHANVAVAAGFSGHGFKFASVVGEILADLAERGATTLPIGMFSLRRSH